MDVLAAHQERVARLRETLERLIGLHRRLHELRSESWREQLSGDPNRAAMLAAEHRQIEDLEAEAEMLREEFRQARNEGGDDSGGLATEPAPEPSIEAGDALSATPSP